MKQPARKTLESTAQALSNAANCSGFLGQYFSCKIKAKPSESIELWPCLGEWKSCTRTEPIYFYQDNRALDRIVNAKPQSYVDIGSHHKYVATLYKVLPPAMADLRPFCLGLESIRFAHETITDLLFPDEGIESASSLHVIEHIGLGRYGDPPDPVGSLKAFNELAIAIKPGETPISLRRLKIILKHTLIHIGHLITTGSAASPLSFLLKKKHMHMR